MEVEISEDGFINLLQKQNGGALIDELDREMIKGTQAIFDHGGTSEIILTIKLKKIPNMNAAVDIGHGVKLKFPKEARPHSAMFVTAGNGLADQFQDQKSLDLGRPVKAVTATLTPIESIKK
jgi:hypothetical protein